MLPEQLIRLESLSVERDAESEFMQLRARALGAGVVRLWRALGQDARRFRHAAETLTGDAWRIAWAEAHDAATDAALDAVY